MAVNWGVLNISDNHMEATLSLNAPQEEEDLALTADHVKAYLKENGIIRGVRDEAVDALVHTAPYGKEVVVAKGKPAQNGKDGTYQYLVPLEDVKSKPVVNEDGSVDYANSLKIAIVKEDEVFAVSVPPTKGEPGYTIFSEELKPISGKEARPLRGKGFKVSEDNKEYSAAYAGRIYKENDKIVVDKIYVVKGDLSIEHGNIKFNGDVEVRGDVRSGLCIDTQGSIFVQGHVGSCTLNAGGNITINKGVQGKGMCEITAKGDIAGSFLERCNVCAQGNIYANSILDCNVYAVGKVVVMSKTGHIVGGRVSGVQGVQAKSIGNNAYIATQIRFRETNALEAEMVKNKNDMIKYLKDIKILDSKLQAFESIDGSKMTKETEALKMKVVRAKVLCISKVRELEQGIRVMTENIELAKEAKVVVEHILYPGVVVGIQDNTVSVAEPLKEVEVIIQGGKPFIRPKQ